MSPKRRKRLRRMSVTGLGVCGVILFLFAASIWFDFGYSSIRRGVSVTIGTGSLHVRRTFPVAESGWGLRRNDLPVHERIRRFAAPSYVAMPRALSIPLWMPFIAIFAPSLFLLLRTTRSQLGHCRACGYNLTGNVSGVCPECGAEIVEGNNDAKRKN